MAVQAAIRETGLKTQCNYLEKCPGLMLTTEIRIPFQQQIPFTEALQFYRKFGRPDCGIRGGLVSTG